MERSSGRSRWVQIGFLSLLVFLLDTLLNAWSRLAQIDPDHFVWSKMSWLTIWMPYIEALSTPSLFVGGAIAIAMLFKRLETTRRTSVSAQTEPLQVVARTPELTVVRLGERDFEFRQGAYEYYERCSASDRDKIVRMLRRKFILTTWSRESFEMEVDEKRRAHIGLDQFLGQAGGLKAEIVNERLVRSSISKAPPSTLGLMAGIPDYTLQRLGNEVFRWRGEVYAFLNKELKGHAEELNLAVSAPSDTTDALGILMQNLDEWVARLVKIKERIP